MSQNTSHAVMAQRSEAKDSLDDFPTPIWATRAMLEHVLVPLNFSIRPDLPLMQQTAWDPACNRGFMSKPLREYFKIVRTSDVHDYSTEPCVEMQGSVGDFLVKWDWPQVIQEHGVRFVISNPPFRLAEEFIWTSFEVKDWRGTAMLVRTSFLEGVGRYEKLFSKRPPTVVAQFAERVPMVRGRCDPTASTATSYCWLIWAKDAEPRQMTWIPPSRKRLERADDYELTAP